MRPTARAGKRAPARLSAAAQPRAEPPADGDDWRGIHTQVDLEAAYVDAADLGDVHWSGGRLTGTRFHRLRAVDVVFRDCDLSGVVLDRATMTRVEFHDCRLSGLVMAGANLSDVLIQGCRLDDANFRQVSGQRVHIIDSDLRGADFGSARVTGLRLQGDRLSGVDFSGAEIPGVRLHGSTLADLRGTGALAGAVIAADQTVPLALQLLGGFGVRVDDDPGE